MSWFKKSLFARIAISIVLGAGIIFLCMMLIKQDQISSLTLEIQEKYYQSLIEKETIKINESFLKAQNAVDVFALNTDLLSAKRKDAAEALNALLSEKTELFGSAIALTPGENTRKSGYSILYAWRDSANKIHVVDRIDIKKDYASDWYKIPYNSKNIYWSPPYHDLDANTNMITYSRPLLHEGTVYAIVTCDLDLKAVEDIVKRTKLGKHGQSMIVSKNGQIIMSTHNDILKNKSLFNLGVNMDNKVDRDTLLDFTETLTQKNSGKVHLEKFMGQKSVNLYFQKINNTDWSICFFVSDGDILAPIKNLTIKMITISFLGIILLLVVAFAVAKSITTPVLKLCEYSRKMAKGDLDHPIPEDLHRDDEIGHLIKTFELMRRKLKDFIKHIETTTAKQEQVQAELNIARDIQHNILPKIFPSFVKSSNLDIFALLNSAKEVGGDLYDFCLLDEDKLYICIGDVSGKGVPASLFMSASKMLMKSNIQTWLDPAKALTHVNKEMAQGNEACMFVTVFMGILNLKTNELTYVNAGHNPPIVIGDGQAEFLDLASAPPIAILPDFEYENRTHQLKTDEHFLLYTDGVTEAMNLNNELYGEDRLKEYGARNKSRTSRKISEDLLKELQEYTNGAQQSDDITLLCVSNNIENKNTLVLNNRPEYVKVMVSWLESLAKENNWDDLMLMKINLILEEWITNVIKYGYEKDVLSEIEIKMNILDNNRVQITCIDDGKAFDPTITPEPNLELELEKRNVGGLGIYFIRQALEKLSYQRVNNQNVVTMEYDHTNINE